MTSTMMLISTMRMPLFAVPAPLLERPGHAGRAAEGDGAVCIKEAAGRGDGGLVGVLRGFIGRFRKAETGYYLFTDARTDSAEGTDLPYYSYRERSLDPGQRHLLPSRGT